MKVLRVRDIFWPGWRGTAVVLSVGALLNIAVGFYIWNWRVREHFQRPSGISLRESLRVHEADRIGFVLVLDKYVGELYCRAFSGAEVERLRFVLAPEHGSDRIEALGPLEVRHLSEPILKWLIRADGKKTIDLAGNRSRLYPVNEIWTMLVGWPSKSFLASSGVMFSDFDAKTRTYPPWQSVVIAGTSLRDGTDVDLGDIVPSKIVWSAFVLNAFFWSGGVWICFLVVRSGVWTHQCWRRRGRQCPQCGHPLQGGWRENDNVQRAEAKCTECGFVLHVRRDAHSR